MLGCTDDTWTATSTTDAPTARYHHTTVWTGAEMIVWGGQDIGNSASNTGGRYNPSTDSWTATSTTGAPAGQNFHSAVWTGTEMIVWGGDIMEQSHIEHRGEVQSRHGQLDRNHHLQRAHRANAPHGSVDRGRNGRLGWIFL